MRTNILLTFFILCYITTTSSYGFQVTHDVTLKDPSKADQSNIHDTIRKKREVETFDNDDYPSTLSQDEQEEPGFWDRVVKFALKLFSRFVEWLNSS